MLQTLLQLGFYPGMPFAAKNASFEAVTLNDAESSFSASAPEFFCICINLGLLCGILLQGFSATTTWKERMKGSKFPLFSTLLEVSIAALFALTLTKEILQSKEQFNWVVITVSAASCAAALWNIISIFLRWPSTIRGIYHLLSCISWTWLIKTPPYLETRAAYACPGIFAAAFLADLLNSRIPQTLPPDISGLSLLEKLSFAWLNPLVESKETLQPEHLPSIDLLVDFDPYLDDFLEACTEQGEAEGIWKPFWSFILRNHRSELIISGILRLIDDISKFSLPFLLREVLGEPSIGKTIFLFCTRTTGALCGNYSNYCLRLIAVKYKAVLSASLHQKALKTGDVKSEAADVIILGEVDSQVLFTAIKQLHDIWAFPFQLILSVGGLAYLLPWQGTVAVGVGILSVYPAINFATTGIRYWMQKNFTAKDYRTKLISEILRLIQSVKIQGWEASLERLVAERRAAELHSLQGVALSDATLICLMQATPAVLTLAAFGVVVWKGSTLDSQLIFSALMLFTMLNSSLMQLSAVASILQAVRVSTGRILKYINFPVKNIKFLGEMKTQSPEESFQFENFRLVWPDDLVVISDGRLVVERGSLTVMTGPTGAGKSSLLISLQRAFERLERSTRKTRVSYLSQNAFLIGGTIRENILFGQSYDAERYASVIDACCLGPDLQRLPSGDRTIFAGSIPLSGGQKARICLARAVYSEVDVYILDDPFAALDVKVQNTINRLLFSAQGLLADATVIVASHSSILLSQADAVYVVDQRTITQTPVSGSAVEVVANGEVVDVSIPTQKKILQESVAEISESESSTQSSGLIDSTATAPVAVEQKSSRHPVISYILSAGAFGWGLPIGLLLAGRFASVYSTNALRGLGVQVTISGQLTSLGIFGLFSFFQTVLFFLFILALYRYCIIPAATTVHAHLVSGILAKDQRFFELTPTGMILNLFTNDISRIDGSLNGSIISMIAQLVNICIVFGVLVISVPLSITFVLPLVLICARLQMAYIKRLRDLRQLDAKSRTPLINYLQETETGRFLFRVHGLARQRIRDYHNLIYTNSCALVPFSSVDIWLTLRLDILSVALQVFALALLTHSVDAGTLGFVMTYVFQVTINLSVLARMFSQLEADAVSISRIYEYGDTAGCDKPARSDKKHSAVPENDGLNSTIPSGWPQGKIEFNNVTAKYHHTAPASLTSVSLTIQPGEKVAIVGRTGAGKSTLAMCLLGLMGQTSGQILIDGIDISDLSPSKLRGSLAVIPQHPGVFPTSLRWNMDPFQLHTDDEIYDALEKAKATDAIASSANQCYSDNQGGFSILDLELDFALSAGQLQLLALARVMLHRSNIVILDEATSGLYPSTEAWIHECMFQTFQHSTMVAIMHKLELTAMYDKILVLYDGKVAEFDTPSALLAKKDGIYSSMIAEAGLKDSTTTDIL